MGKWYGEQHELSTNELNHILRMYHECEERQKAGECEHGFNEFTCSGCPCHTALMALRSCDDLTKSRMREKEKMLVRRDVLRRAQKRRTDLCAVLCSAVFGAWAVFLLVIFLKLIGGSR